MSVLLITLFLLIIGIALTIPKIDWGGQNPTQESVGLVLIILATILLLMYIGFKLGYRN